MSKDKKKSQTDTSSDLDDFNAAFGWISEEHPSSGNSCQESSASEKKPAASSPGGSPSDSRLQALLSTTRRMSSVTHIEELLPLILDEIITFTKADRGLLFLYEDYEELIEAEEATVREPLLSIKVARDKDQNDLPTVGVRVSHSVVQEVAQRGEAVYLFDAPEDDDYASRQSIVSLRLNRIMCAPLRAFGQLQQLKTDSVHSAPQERVIGVVYIDSQSKASQFTQDDLEIFQALVNNAATAIENTWINEKLYSSLREVSATNRRLGALQDVSKAVTSTLILDELLALILDKCISLTQAQRGCLILRNEDGSPDFRTARNKDERDIEVETLKVSNTTVHRTLDYGEMVVINDLDQQRIGDADESGSSIVDLQLKAIICVPLMVPVHQREEEETLDQALDHNHPLSETRRIIGCIYVDSNLLSHSFSNEDAETLQTFAQQAAISIQNAKLYEESEEQLFEAVAALAATIDAKDAYTHGHSYRVAKFSALIAEELGFGKHALRRVYLAGLLHDIGKVGVPDAVLGKPGGLTDDEFAFMKMHPVHGANIIGKVKRMRDLMGAMEHHEKIDGTGYPKGLVGEEISLIGRIISVADAFDAMTSDRVYRKGLGINVAIEELEAKVGRQFDEECVAAFLRAYGKGNIEPLVNYVPEPANAH